MGVHDVLPDAFLLGTGVSRTKALQSKRFETLKKTFPKVPYLSTEESTEMQLLGEMIADRAFRTLPFQLRNLASVWQDVDHQAQLDILRTLYDTLGRKSLARREQKEEDRENQALPHQYGSWTRRRYQPSCLGVAQMLVGFARVAGADHLLIDVLQPRGIYREELMYRGLSKVKLLIKESGDEKLFRRLEKHVDEALVDVIETLDINYKNHQAHHALAIRVGEKWWGIDPYFEVFCPLDDNPKWTDKLHKDIEQYPRMGLMRLQDTYLCDTELKTREAGLEAIATYLKRLDEPIANWRYSKIAIKYTLKSLIFYDMDDATEASATEKTAETVVANMLSPIAVKRFSRKAESERKEGDLNAFLAQQREKADHTKRYRNICMKRLVYDLAANYCAALLQADRDNQPPNVQELSHGTFQLAVRTVNQLGFMRSIDTPELVLYSRSQWILRDSLDALQRTSSKRLQRVAKQRMKYLSQHPEFLMPDFRLHLEDKVGKQ